MKNLICSVTTFFILFFTAGCTDNAIIDQSESIPNQNWTYAKPIKITADVQDISKPYHVYVNFRHTADYKYANIWIKVTEVAADKTKKSERQEFQLALPDGEWMGKGSGNLYSYQLILHDKFKFPVKGKYTYLIEQNMRDNPLRAVSDIGLRIEPVE